jgi:hypothetical protein
MFTKFLFTCLSASWQVSLMQKKGIMLGTRKREGRQVYTYMLRDLFAEVVYLNDNPNESPETIVVIPGLKKLNDHMEKEIRLPYHRYKKNGAAS